MLDLKFTDGKAEITEEQFAEIKKEVNDTFNKGFGKGKETGTKEVIGKLDFLELDPEKLDDSVNKIKQPFIDFKEGKIPEETLKKYKDKDKAVETLQEQLRIKDEALTKRNAEFESYQKKMLIDNKLISLGGMKEHKAVNAEDAALLFQRKYKIEIKEGDKLTIYNENGTPLFSEKGDELPLDAVYANFASANPHLYETDSKGGSGGGDGLPVGDGVTFDDLKSDEQKAAYVAKYGFEQYKKLVDTKVNATN